MILNEISNLNNSFYFKINNIPEDWNINILNCSRITTITNFNCVQIDEKNKTFNFQASSLNLSCNEIYTDVLNFNEQLSSSTLWSLSSINTPILNATSFNGCYNFSIGAMKNFYLSDCVIDNLWYEDQMFDSSLHHKCNAGSAEQTWVWNGIDNNALYILDVTCSVTTGNANIDDYQISSFLIFNPNITTEGFREIYSDWNWKSGYRIAYDSTNNNWVFTHNHMTNEDFTYTLYKQPIYLEKDLSLGYTPKFKITLKYMATLGFGVTYYKSDSSRAVLPNGSVTYHSSNLHIELPASNYYLIIKNIYGNELFYFVNGTINIPIDQDVIVEIDNTEKIGHFSVSTTDLGCYKVYTNKNYLPSVEVSRNNSAIIYYLANRTILFVKYSKSSNTNSFKLVINNDESTTSTLVGKLSNMGKVFEQYVKNRSDLETIVLS
jgi:hypothetical protein